jgi:hypothetical protein
LKVSKKAAKKPRVERSAKGEACSFQVGGGGG